MYPNHFLLLNHPIAFSLTAVPFWASHRQYRINRTQASLSTPACVFLDLSSPPFIPTCTSECVRRSSAWWVVELGGGQAPANPSSPGLRPRDETSVHSSEAVPLAGSAPAAGELQAESTVPRRRFCGLGLLAWLRPTGISMVKVSTVSCLPREKQSILESFQGRACWALHSGVCIAGGGMTSPFSSPTESCHVSPPNEHRILPN